MLLLPMLVAVCELMLVVVDVVCLSLYLTTWENTKADSAIHFGSFAHKLPTET